MKYTMYCQVHTHFVLYLHIRIEITKIITNDKQNNKDNAIIVKDTNTPGTRKRVGPGGCDRTLAVKSIQFFQKTAFVKKMIFYHIPSSV